MLPLVYDELRRLAAQKMAQEGPDHTLQATALVHEAYLRATFDDSTNHANLSWTIRTDFVYPYDTTIQKLHDLLAGGSDAVAAGEGLLRW